MGSIPTTPYREAFLGVVPSARLVVSMCRVPRRTCTRAPRRTCDPRSQRDAVRDGSPACGHINRHVPAENSHQAGTKAGGRTGAYDERIVEVSRRTTETGSCVGRDRRILRVASSNSIRPRWDSPEPTRGTKLRSGKNLSTGTRRVPRRPPRGLSSTTMKLVAALLCLAVSRTNAQPSRSETIEDTTFWMKSGQENLRRILSLRDNENRARNIILFVGDGMGMTTVTAGRIFQGQRKGGTGEEYKLNFEEFPSTGFSKTYNVDKQVPDSAATATAIFSGVKCRYKVVGFDARARPGRCNATLNKISRVSTIAEWAQAVGKDTGFVTTTRITHATPAALYAHANDREWECDSMIPPDQRDCAKDIGRQLVEDSPGRDFKVVMGGGGQSMGTSPRVENAACARTDGRNLVREWQRNNPGGKTVTNTGELMGLDTGNASKVLGIFSPNHVPYHALRDVSDAGSPSLANMTLQAIRIMRGNRNGFFLLVESGRIDLAHHNNFARLALHEVAALEEAVQVALDQVNLDETLIIVTADHSHAFTMNGYPERGNDITGFANKTDEVPYETLAYTNGPGFLYHRRNDSNAPNETWRLVAEDPNRGDAYYRHFAGVYLPDETHGGEDVAVYAIGPYAHLFRGTFEQNYIAHVVAYAGCLQDWPSHCDNSYHHDRIYRTNGAGPIAAETSLRSCVAVVATIYAYWTLLLAIH